MHVYKGYTVILLKVMYVRIYVSHKKLTFYVPVRPTTAVIVVQLYPQYTHTVVAVYP